MARIIIAYGTTDGYTRKVVSHIATRLRDQGHEALAFDTTAVPRRFDPSRIDVFILAGSIHWNHLQRSLREFVRENGAVLRHAPTALLPVGLRCCDDTDSSNRKLQAEIDAFVRHNGWTPQAVIPVAGALLYTQYGFLKRQLMRYVSRRHGQPTDTSTDHEFTDWVALDRSVDEFVGGNR